MNVLMLAFCGFFVAKADAKLFNESSQVVLVRDGDRTVLTMGSDYKGDPKEFALVVPVPTVLEKEQIHVGDQKLVDRIDAYSVPRLVEYFDPDPCIRNEVAYGGWKSRAKPSEAAGAAQDERARALGVTIEAKYTVGEYDILILSAKQSDGLETWLKQEGYKIPNGASAVLGSYLKQGMKFFVAKVNLKEQEKLGFSKLRPLQMAYETPKFMLPIRLGTVNAQGPQDLFVYAITKNGRVETTNYRTLKLPSDTNVPGYVKDEFGDFYKALFTHQVKKENSKAVFVEYAWNMAWCDPCASDPLTSEELRGLGVFWVGKGPDMGGGAQQAFVTRLHVRYDAKNFPEDLVFQETTDSSNFQGRYILQHPFKGATCDGADAYYQQVYERQKLEAKNLATLTGWEVSDIEKKMKLEKPKPVSGNKWYEDLWK